MWKGVYTGRAKKRVVCSENTSQLDSLCTHRVMTRCQFIELIHSNKI
jgi:hypothetical protein